MLFGVEGQAGVGLLGPLAAPGGYVAVGRDPSIREVSVSITRVLFRGWLCLRFRVVGGLCGPIRWLCPLLNRWWAGRRQRPKKQD